jgi:crossover junction endodeoxyribonuclease RuvC
VLDHPAPTGEPLIAPPLAVWRRAAVFVKVVAVEPPARFPGTSLILMRILGLDPGLEITGYAVLDTGPKVCEAGVIRTTEHRSPADMARRLCSLYNGIVEVIQQFRPEVAALEQLFAHYEHPRTAILMAHARGVLFLAAAQHDVPVVSYNATRIKKTVTGSGRASKEQVQRTVQRELGLATLPEPPDVADALAAALCHYYVQRLPA